MRPIFFSGGGAQLRSSAPSRSALVPLIGFKPIVFSFKLIPGRRLRGIRVRRVVLALISVFMDSFRRHDMSGWAKAIWVIALIVFPTLGCWRT
jgi:hypothetical protein